MGGIKGQRTKRWTDEENEQLEILAAQKWSGSMIANEIGRTRNSVIAQARKVGVKLQGTNAQSKAASVITKSGEKVYKAVRKRPFIFQGHLAVPKNPVVVKDSKPLRESKPVTLMELAFDGCRWPIEGGLFCNSTQDDASSYCATHRKIAHHRY